MLKMNKQDLTKSQVNKGNITKAALVYYICYCILMLKISHAYSWLGKLTGIGVLYIQTWVVSLLPSEPSKLQPHVNN